MAIRGVTDEDLKHILSENLTPSDSIKTPERLFGREKTLTTIDRAFSSPGRQIFIYGDRGVGKTSLAQTTAYLHTGVENQPIYVMCGKTNDFGQTIRAIGNALIPVEERLEKAASGGSFNFSLPGGMGGVGVSSGTKGHADIPVPGSLTEALDIIRYVASKRRNTTIIIIDELERIDSSAEREKFAEFIRNIPELSADVRFIFCGIMHDVTELLQSHASAGRILETVELKRLNHSDLWKILTVVAKKLNVEIQEEALIRIGQVSDGFPHYVHLIGECLFWAMFDDTQEVKKSGPEHFKTAITGALQRTEAALRAAYEKATHKTRNTADYEEALWALADSTSDKRQIAQIYETSYKWIMLKRTGRKSLTREQLNQRYLSMRKESHSRIVAGFGSGWFAFRENIMRGYVRLRAESQGINLGRHNNTAGMP
jgi:DNA polymerase III delta prime subunit